MHRLIIVALVGSSTLAAASPAIGVSPNPADCGNVPVGSMGMPVAVTITNTGTSTLHINAFSLDGQDSTDFSISDPIKPPLTLNPNAMIPFHVVFTPSRMDVESATVTIGSDDPNSPSYVVNVTGTGSTAMLSFAPMAIDFGSLPAGGASVPMALMIVNGGGAAATITAIDLTGQDASQFSLDNMGPLTVPANGSATMHAKFTPNMVGSFSAAISFTAPGIMPTVALTGTATPPTLVPSPITLDFGWQGVGSTSDLQTVALKNTGAAPVVIMGIASSDPQFVIDQSHTALQVAPNTVTTFSVTFHPARLGEATAQINVGTQGVPMAAQLVATGTGVMASLDMGVRPASDMGRTGGDMGSGDLAGGPSEVVYHRNGSCAVGGGPASGLWASLALLAIAALHLRRRR